MIEILTGLFSAVSAAELAKLKLTRTRASTAMRSHSRRELVSGHTISFMVMALTSLIRGARLHHHLARCVADSDGSSAAARQVHNGEIVGALICHVRCFPVSRHRCPVRLFANRHAAYRHVRCRVEQEELARPLYNDDPECGVARIADKMGRDAGGNLRDDFSRGGIHHLNRAHSGLSEIEHPAIEAEFSVARRLVERHGPSDAACCHIDQSETEMTGF